MENEIIPVAVKVVEARGLPGSFTSNDNPYASQPHAIVWALSDRSAMFDVLVPPQRCSVVELGLDEDSVMAQEVEVFTTAPGNDPVNPTWHKKSKFTIQVPRSSDGTPAMLNVRVLRKKKLLGETQIPLNVDGQVSAGPWRAARSPARVSRCGVPLGGRFDYRELAPARLPMLGWWAAPCNGSNCRSPGPARGWETSNSWSKWAVPPLPSTVTRSWVMAYCA